MALASFGPLLWNDNNSLSVLAILLNVEIGMGMIFATRKHLHALDELQRKIQLEAMAITLGLAVVVGLAYSLLEQTNLINYHVKISHLVIFIGLTYLLVTLIGNYRYK